MTVIDIRGLSFSYAESATLSNINLQVEQGEFLGIVGPNAGGKSTLLKLILGLLRPTQGQINVFGRKPQQVRRRIGYVSQYPAFKRDFPISVEQTVLMGSLGSKNSRFWGTYNQSERKAAHQALEKMKAADLAKRHIGTLSGGQVQRVLLARALVSQPQLLILDEPTANVDMRMEEDIFDLLAKVKEQMTILVVSHDIGFISAYVNRVACVNRELECHSTEHLDGKLIDSLYHDHVHRIVHHH